MSNGIKSPVETTSKIRTYVKNLVESLKKDLLDVDQAEIIDTGALLDDIAKVATKYVKELKKELDFGSDIEIDGNVARARVSESRNVTIPAHVFYNEVSQEDFFRAVKVSLTDAKKLLPESRFNEIAIELEPTTKISFQLKHK